MFTDIKGFTEETSRRTRYEVGKFIEFQDQIIRPIIENFGGKIIKTIGDSYMVSFESPTNAVLCGIAIQKAVKNKISLIFWKTCKN